MAEVTINLPVPSLNAWTFALRTWTAMMLALAAAFWLQLEGAASAAVCVGILALQTRGQTLHKAAYRVLGTAIGLVAAVVIAGIFAQMRELFFLACCGWLGLCTMLASLLGGNQAYAAILSGYTVSIVALSNIDTPLSTFASGVNRGAAIILGILSVAFVSALFAAPDLYTRVLAKVESAQQKVMSFVITSLREGRAASAEASALLKEIAALHPDILALSPESAVGKARAAAARETLISLMRTVSAARVISGLLGELGEAGKEPRNNLIRALESRDHDDVAQRAFKVLEDGDSPSTQRIAASACLTLFEQDKTGREAIAAMRSGRGLTRASKIAFYKPRQGAVLNGLRAAVALGLSAWGLSLLGWSSAVTTLVQISAMMALGATTPNTRGFAVTALIGVPIAVAASGLTEFFVLNGVDQFELLALGMAPTIIIACLMIASSKPFLNGIGFLMIVFFPTFLSLSNPQKYNPETYLFISFFSVLAVSLLFVLTSLLFPTTHKMQARWMLKSARTDLREALFGSRRRLDAPACAFRDADRIGQFGSLALPGDRDESLRYLFRLSDLASCARRIRAAIEENDRLHDRRQDVAQALASLDAARLQKLGRSLLVESVKDDRSDIRMAFRVGADLMFASILIDRSPRLAAELRQERRP